MGTTKPQNTRITRLQDGADLGGLRSPPLAPAPLSPARLAPPPIKTQDVRDAPPPMSCQQTLTLSFFFDGTGNNLDADLVTAEHSNVTRLYRAHRLDSEAEGIYSFYLPGIGTLFKDREVNDPGGTMTGKAFGAQGQDRLDWAFARLTEKITAAEARAQNPTNKICWIKVAVFGFSRGAALARAFARDLQARCQADASSSTGWSWKAGAYPVEITFMGLFDTVASVGLPPSANNLHRNRYAKAVEWVNPVGKLIKTAVETPELKRLAFGEPGADPAPGTADGHADWAEDLTIGSMVKRCLHMTAAHEHRNSFALDSTLVESRAHYFSFPEGTTEAIYPGVHSDVGGGYRPGEHGTKPDKGAQLSLIPLRAMHAAAIESVPLRPLSAFVDKLQKEDFAVDPEGSKHYAHMLDLVKHYVAAVPAVRLPSATVGMGGQLNQHMHLYFAWRFYAIHTKGSSAQAAQRAQVGAHEQQFNKDRAALDEKRKVTRADLRTASARVDRLQSQVNHEEMARLRYGAPVSPQLKQQLLAAQEQLKQKQAADDRIRAQQDTAADDGALNASVDKYDQMLLEDARQIVAWMKEDKALKLRPHYAALVEAYLNEYERGKGLRDPKIIELFAEYVHNSMAAFAKDESWSSDPRIVYVGGDHKFRYANTTPRQPVTERTSLA